MTMKNKKIVVFDLDGTLNKTELYAVPAHKKALADFGIYDKTDEQIIANFGARMQDCIHLLLGECDKETVSSFIKKYSQYEMECINECAGEFDGVTDLLNRLKEDGYILAICSNASERYIKMVLNALNLSNKIDFIQPLLPNMKKSDTLRLLLEKVNPNKAIMVGDRIYDKEAAYANNIPFIGCKYGFNADEVADADVAVNSPSEIYDAVIKLFG